MGLGFCSPGQIVPAGSSLSHKIQPVIDTLNNTFVKCYSPSQELSVDEAMVKYNGCVGGKVAMPKKPIKVLIFGAAPAPVVGTCALFRCTMADLLICRQEERLLKRVWPQG